MKVDSIDLGKELHLIDGTYYIVSQVVAPDHGDWETMIFYGDKNGNITNFLDLYCYIGYEELKDSVTKFTQEILDAKGHSDMG